MRLAAPAAGAGGGCFPAVGRKRLEVPRLEAGGARG